MWVDERSQAGSKGDESGSEGEIDGGGDSRSKIAWRYGGMEKFRTSIGMYSCLSSGQDERGADKDRRDWSIELIDYSAEVYH